MRALLYSGVPLVLTPFDAARHMTVTSRNLNRVATAGAALARSKDPPLARFLAGRFTPQGVLSVRLAGGRLRHCPRRVRLLGAPRAHGF